MTLPLPDNVIVWHVQVVFSIFFFFFFLHVSVIPKFILPGQFFCLFIGFAVGQPETRPDVVVRSLYL